MNKLFKINGIGFDTRTIRDKEVSSVYPGLVSNYVITSISANNDYLLTDFIKDSTASLVVVVDFEDGLVELLKDHLKVLGRDKADVLMFSVDIRWDMLNLDELKNLTTSFGIYYPSNPEQLDNIPIDYKYVGLTVSPLDYNHEVMMKCKDKIILGFNPMGGYISGPRNIQAFGVGYLLGFSAMNSDIPVLSGRDMFSSWKSYRYLIDLIGKETDTDYVINRSLYKPVDPLKKAIYSSIEVKDNIIDFDIPDVPIPESIFKIEKAMVSLTESDEGGCTDIEHFLIDNVYLPKEAPQSVKSARIRYKLLEYFKITRSKWDISFATVGDKVLCVMLHEPITKGKYFWSKPTGGEVEYYSIIIPGEQSNIRVYCEANAPEKPLNP